MGISEVAAMMIMMIGVSIIKRESPEEKEIPQNNFKSDTLGWRGLGVVLGGISVLSLFYFYLPK